MAAIFGEHNHAHYAITRSVYTPKQRNGAHAQLSDQRMAPPAAPSASSSLKSPAGLGSPEEVDPTHQPPKCLDHPDLEKLERREIPKLELKLGDSETRGSVADYIDSSALLYSIRRTIMGDIVILTCPSFPHQTGCNVFREEMTKWAAKNKIITEMCENLALTASISEDNRGPSEFEPDMAISLDRRSNLAPQIVLEVAYAVDIHTTRKKAARYLSLFTRDLIEAVIIIDFKRSGDSVTSIHLECWNALGATLRAQKTDRVRMVARKVRVEGSDDEKGTGFKLILDPGVRFNVFDSFIPSRRNQVETYHHVLGMTFREQIYPLPSNPTIVIPYANLLPITGADRTRTDCDLSISRTNFANKLISAHHAYTLKKRNRATEDEVNDELDNQLLKLKRKRDGATDEVAEEGERDSKKHQGEA